MRALLIYRYHWEMVVYFVTVKPNFLGCLWIPRWNQLLCLTRTGSVSSEFWIFFWTESSNPFPASRIRQSLVSYNECTVELVALRIWLIENFQAFDWIVFYRSSVVIKDLANVQEISLRWSNVSQCCLTWNTSLFISVLAWMSRIAQLWSLDVAHYFVVGIF